MMPTIENYGRHSSSNYGAHTLCVSMGGVDVYFSYRTPVAFRTRSQPLIVRENEWGPTTGKHLNWIDGGDKASRIDGGEFQRRLAEALA